MTWVRLIALYLLRRWKGRTDTDQGFLFLLTPLSEFDHVFEPCGVTYFSSDWRWIIPGVFWRVPEFHIQKLQKDDALRKGEKRQ